MQSNNKLPHCPWTNFTSSARNKYQVVILGVCFLRYPLSSTRTRFCWTLYTTRCMFRFTKKKKRSLFYFISD